MSKLSAVDAQAAWDLLTDCAALLEATAPEDAKALATMADRYWGEFQKLHAEQQAAMRAKCAADERAFQLERWEARALWAARAQSA